MRRTQYVHSFSPSAPTYHPRHWSISLLKSTAVTPRQVHHSRRWTGTKALLAQGEQSRRAGPAALNYRRGFSAISPHYLSRLYVPFSTVLSAKVLSRVCGEQQTSYSFPGNVTSLHPVGPVSGIPDPSDQQGARTLCICKGFRKAMCDHINAR